MGIYIDAVTRENIMEASQKFKNKTTMWSSNSNSAYLLMKTTTLIEKDIDTSVFIVSAFTIASYISIQSVHWQMNG